MAELEKYINEGVMPEVETLDALLNKYPWFAAARMLKKEQESGEKNRYDIDVDRIAEESEGEIISRFLRKGDYRIVAEEGETDDFVQTEAEIDDEIPPTSIVREFIGGNSFYK